MNRTIISDIDGCVFQHKNTLMDEDAPVLPGVIEKVNEWYNDGDVIIFLSARPESYRNQTIKQLKNAGIPFHHLILEVNTGRRYLINDTKPAGYRNSLEDYPEEFITTVAIPVKRDYGFKDIEL